MSKPLSSSPLTALPQGKKKAATFCWETCEQGCFLGSFLRSFVFLPRSTNQLSSLSTEVKAEQRGHTGSESKKRNTEQRRRKKISLVQIHPPFLTHLHPPSHRSKGSTKQGRKTHLVGLSKSSRRLAQSHKPFFCSQETRKKNQPSLRIPASGWLLKRRV